MRSLTPKEVDRSDTIVDALRLRAEHQPDRAGLVFLLDGEREEDTRTFAQLDERARATAVGLRERIRPGEPVLVVHPPGLEFHEAFFGALYAGAVPVPAYPPDPLRLERSSTILGTIAADIDARVALTSDLVAGAVEPVVEAAPKLGAVEWLTPGDVLGDADAWQRPDLNEDTLAFLQYTSGSTSMPKGVMITHGNLVAQSRLLRDELGIGEHTVCASWCPLYHDMGLVTGVAAPVYMGIDVILMSPLDFLARPARWLEAITRYRANTAGGPNFSYDLCARRTTFEERERLDLSSWEIAFNAAEPIRGETLDRFARAFGPVGFRRGAFVPSFGLAECVCMIASSTGPDRPAIRDFDADRLGGGQGVEASDGSTPKTLVASGRIAAHHELLVVDPDTRVPQPAGTVGEVWIRGPSVAGGYWRNEEKTAETFRGETADGDGPFMRTGDLGFVDGEQLYVTGRIKDLIIVRGRNLYPQDLEASAQRAVPELRPGCGSAFSIAGEEGESVVLVQEVRDPGAVDTDTVVAQAREAIAREHGVDAAVVLIEPRSIPKTSSGKLQRTAARRQYEEGALRLVGAGAPVG